LSQKFGKKKPLKKADLVTMWVGTRLVPKGVLPTIMVFISHFLPFVMYITRHNGGSSWVNLTLKGSFVKEEGPSIPWSQIVDIQSLSLLRSGSKNPPHLTLQYLWMFRCMITLGSYQRPFVWRLHLDGLQKGKFPTIIKIWPNFHFVFVGN
jgi:hypothetical protein